MEALYNWELLEVKHQADAFARCLGHMLKVVPRKHAVHVHTLIGEALVIANAIAGGHADRPADMPQTTEERTVWLTIGLNASRMACERIILLIEATSKVDKHAEEALDLLKAIVAHFASEITMMESPRHLA